MFDWVFNDAAEIDVRVGATGIDSVKGVATQTMTDSTAASDTRYGTLVAPNLVAVNHDHYFNFRLDLDVDGPRNSFNRDTYRPVRLPPGSPRRSLYVVEPTIAAIEKAGLGTGHEPAKFRVVNEAHKNAVGNGVATGDRRHRRRRQFRVHGCLTAFHHESRRCDLCAEHPAASA